MKRKRQELTAEGRLAAFEKDLRLLDQLTKVVHRKALDSGDNTAWGHLDLKCLERRAAMFGYDSPSRFDMTLIAEQRRPSTVEALESAFAFLAGQPDQLSKESRASLANGGYLPPGPEPGSDAADALESDALS